jgi:Ca2+-binding RTX toxin-like protein
MQIETLEGRCLMTAAVVDGVLTVTGDDTDNHVRVVLDGRNTAATDDDALVVIEHPLVWIDARSVPVSQPHEALHRFPAPPFAPAGTRTDFNIGENGITSVVINLGGGDDIGVVARTVKLTAALNGGPGDDALAAGGGTSTLNGGDGDDYLRGGAGADALNGNAGNDTIEAGGGGADAIDGGDDGAGDIAFVDTEGGQDPAADPDVVSNVEAIRPGNRRGPASHGFDTGVFAVMEFGLPQAGYLTRVRDGTATPTGADAGAGEEVSPKLTRRERRRLARLARQTARAAAAAAARLSDPVQPADTVLNAGAAQ